MQKKPWEKTSTHSAPNQHSFSKTSSIVDTAWVRHYGSGLVSSIDRANDLVVDNAGNVYVTGESGEDYATIKYNSHGAVVWQRRYNGPGNGRDYATSLAVDGSGNVYITGGSGGSGTNLDYATIKYNPQGDTTWVRRYNDPENSSDVANALAVDGYGNVYITGDGGVGGTVWSYAHNTTIKYDSVGDTVWVRKFQGGRFSSPEPVSIVVNANGDVYVTANTSLISFTADCELIKYNSAGDTMWVRIYNNSPTSSIAVDGSGNVYITGFSWVSNSSSDYATIKYNSNGDTLWVRRYNGSGNGRNYATSLAVVGSGNVYVTGSSNNPNTGYDFVTIKYNSNGDTLWTRRYNGSTNHDDWAISLALDGSGNVYVTGSSDSSIVTIRYSTNGNEEWSAKYRYANGSSYPVGIRVDASGNVYVSGTSTGTDGSVYTTIMYIQTPNSVQDNNVDLPMQFGLEQNYPNPFNPFTTIRYSLPSSANVKLALYDLLGREIVTLVNEEQSAGWKEVPWNASTVSSGIYFYKITAGSFVETKKCLVVK